VVRVVWEEREVEEAEEEAEGTSGNQSKLLLCSSKCQRHLVLLPGTSLDIQNRGRGGSKDMAILRAQPRAAKVAA